MAFLKRVSNSLWDYVSPSKKPSLPTPKTGAVNTTGLLPARKTSLEQAVKHARSMSPSEKIKGWPVQTPTSSVFDTRKRRRSDASSSLGAGRPIKQPKLRPEDMEDMQSLRESLDGDVVMEDQYEDEEDEDRSHLQTPVRYRYRTTSPSTGKQSAHDSMSVGDTVMIGDDELQNSHPKFDSLDTAAFLGQHHATTEELRAKEWDDDLITLYQKILLRGHEPLLPSYMKFEYRFWPDAFFEEDDDAFIASVRGDQFRAGNALSKLFEIGGYVRDACLLVDEGYYVDFHPQEEVRRLFNPYLRWARADAGLDIAQGVSVLAQIYQPEGTPGDHLIALAKEKCRKLARKWKNKFQVVRSVEFSPASDGTMLSYEVPTLYALVASYTNVGILAYRPDADELIPMFSFNFDDKDSSVYSSLALAMLGCHVRNVEARIAEETMIGLKRPNSGEEDDPDA